MKFTVNNKEILNAIKGAAKAVPAHSYNADLEALKITLTGDSLTVTGYDLKMGIIETVPCKSANEGSFLILPKLTEKILKALPGGDVTFEVDENYNLTITADNTDFEIKASTAENYPDFTPISALDGKVLSISLSTLKNMIDQTIYAISKNYVKPVLTGEYFDIKDGYLNIVGIDGFRMAVSKEKVNTKENYSFIVPGKTLKQLLSLMPNSAENCEIYANGEYTLFNFGNIQIGTRQIDGIFHMYERSIPQSFVTTAKLEKNTILKAAKQADLLLNDKNKSPLKFVITDSKTTMSLKSGIGKLNKTMPTIGKTGEDITIGFNKTYIEEAIAHINTQSAALHFNGYNKAVMICDDSAENKTIHIVMPLQLKD